MGNSISNSRNDSQVPSEKLGYSSTDWPVRCQEFMKGGGCKESFMAYIDCEEAEKNKEGAITKCVDLDLTLSKCMEAHSDYYQPFLAAEKAAQEEWKEEVEAFLTKEGVAEGEVELEVRFYEFLKGGGCKESLTAWQDCDNEADKDKDDIPKCMASFSTFVHCVEAHSDYYQPLLAGAKAAEEASMKELEAFLTKEGDAEGEDE